MTTTLRPSGTRTALLACVCALAVTTAAGDVRADQIVAQRLFLQATTLAAQARNEPDPARRTQLLERANGDLRTIVGVHTDSALAAQLANGMAVGGFDPRAFEKDLAAARAAAPAAAAPPPPKQQQAAAVAPPAPPAAKAPPAPPQTTTPPSRHQLPVAPVDPKSTAGKIVADVVGALGNTFVNESDIEMAVAKPITAEQSGETVIVTFPGMRLISEDAWLDLGDVRLEVTPKPEDRYAFALHVPPTMVGYTAGQADSRITVAGEPITGLWSPGLSAFLRLYVNLRDLKMETIVPEPAQLVSIASIKAEQRGDLDGKRMSADFHLDIRDTVANEPGATQQLRIGHMALNTKMHDLDLDMWRRVSDAVQSDPTGASGAGIRAGLELLSKPSWSRIGTTITISDVDFSEQGKTQAAFGGMHLGLDMDGRPRSGATMGLKLGMEKMRIDEVPFGDIPPTMVPHSFVIETALEGLPLQGLAKAALENGDAAEGAMMMELMNAQPTLNIGQVGIASEEVQSHLTGSVKFDPQSALAGAGTLTLKIAGLDQIKAYLDRQGKKDPELRQYIPGVVLLRGLGNDAKLGGAKAKEFKVVIGKDGNVTINGTPWQALLEGAQEEKPKAKNKRG